MSNLLAFSFSESIIYRKTFGKNFQKSKAKPILYFGSQKYFFGKKIKSVQIENILAIPYQKIARKKNKKNWCAVFGPGGGFFGVGTSELIVIGAVAWLVLGPKRLYQLARDIGKISGELKNVAEEARQTFQQAIDLENIENETKVKDGKLKTTKEEDDSKNRKVKKSYMKELDNLVVTDIALNEKKKDEKP